MVLNIKFSEMVLNMVLNIKLIFYFLVHRVLQTRPKILWFVGVLQNFELCLDTNVFTTKAFKNFKTWKLYINTFPSHKPILTPTSRSRILEL